MDNKNRVDPGDRNLFGRGGKGSLSESVIAALDEAGAYIDNIPPGEWGADTVYLSHDQKGEVAQRVDKMMVDRLPTMRSLAETMYPWVSENLPKLREYGSHEKFTALWSKLKAYVHSPDQKPSLTADELRELRTHVQAINSSSES